MCTGDRLAVTRLDGYKQETCWLWPSILFMHSIDLSTQMLCPTLSACCVLAKDALLCGRNDSVAYLTCLSAQAYMPYQSRREL